MNKRILKSINKSKKGTVDKKNIKNIQPDIFKSKNISNISFKRITDIKPQYNGKQTRENSR